MKTPSVRQYKNAYAIRVKRDPFNRTYGVRVRSHEPANCKAWPGEDGVLDYRLLQGRDWWQVLLEASFPGGRRLTVAVTPIAEGEAPEGVPLADAGRFELESGFHAEAFVLVRKAPAPEAVR